ncbi:hypothetical protein B0T14DRAFT_87973 [Immersiella caudata]|uniref:Uncharacterized protein n=1 Tax=Immersiella caudata TaxID=314043 RepID=A0AA40C5I0_9PEZI|nr:hypothetical protein B0T14DRAFT_87973 [Immersiella caudata]
MGGYFVTRAKIANFNYWGEWGKLVVELENLEAVGRMGWVNCWRIWTGSGQHKGSGFNALHQAAWHGASQDVVKRLLHLGAWSMPSTITFPTLSSRPRANYATA